MNQFSFLLIAKQNDEISMCYFIFLFFAHKIFEISEIKPYIANPVIIIKTKTADFVFLSAALKTSSFFFLQFEHDIIKKNIRNPEDFIKKTRHRFFFIEYFGYICLITKNYKK